MEAEAPGEAGRNLLTATLILAGLRYSRLEVRDWFKGVTKMRESDTYMMILEEGREEGRAEGELREARTLLLSLGERRFGGPPDEATLTELNAINERGRLEELTLRVLDVTTWQDLLATPDP